jgi:sterol 3beta-glucosyltransferase
VLHITILSAGTRGDVQPFVALGLGLKTLGYSVRLATHPIFEKLAEERGLEFFSAEKEIFEQESQLCSEKYY